MNPPTRAAQQHDVTTLALDGKVFIERADDSFFGQCNNCIERVVGNRAAIRDGDHAASSAGFKNAIHAIAMQIRSVTTAAGSDAVGEYGHDLLKVVLGQAAIGVS